MARVDENQTRVAGQNAIVATRNIVALVGGRGWCFGGVSLRILQCVLVRLVNGVKVLNVSTRRRRRRVEGTIVLTNMHTTVLERTTN